MDLPFQFEQVLNNPIDQVWQALTDQNAMMVWYFPQLRKFKPEVGYEMRFEDDGNPFQKQWIVTQVQNGKRLAHTWTYRGYPGASEVIFELFPEDDKTKLKLTHSGLASFPNDPHFARQRFEEGWKSIIGNKLKQYLRQGQSC